DQLYARCGEHLVALDDAGKITWACNLGKRVGEGSLLLASGSTVVTDMRTGPGRTTEIVGVRAGAIVYRTAIGLIVGSQGGCVLENELFVVVVDPKGGSALRTIRIDNGERRLDRKLSGRDVATAHGRLLVLNSFSEPG